MHIYLVLFHYIHVHRIIAESVQTGSPCVCVCTNTPFSCVCMFKILCKYITLTFTEVNFQTLLNKMKFSDSAIAMVGVVCGFFSLGSTK